MKQRYLLNALAANNIDPTDLNTWLQEAETKQQWLIDTICQNNYISEDAIATACSHYYYCNKIDIFSLDNKNINMHFSQRLYKKDIPAIILNNGHIIISNPYYLHFETIFALETKQPSKIFFAEHLKLNQFIHQLLAKDDYNTLDKNSEDSSAIHFINQLLDDAIQNNASDLHLEPTLNKLRIRMRINGKLQQITEQNSSKTQSILSRVKLLANCDLAEQRKPQDGRFQFYSKTKQKRDCRVSCIPTQHGEKIVIRLLASQQQILSIEKLGMNQQQRITFMQAIKKPQGLILVTGPTGSGKTNTLYTALHHLNNIDQNISTIEDPIEIELPGINQVNVNPFVQLNFASALRAFLRQDPDIIMVGEIRDFETADIAIKAAQTGHLVLSTLHTNGAPETLARLINMGIAHHNLMDSLQLIIAQRLIRILCEHCKTPYKHAEHGTLYASTGCNRCNQGYQGRTGIFELLACNQKLLQELTTHKDKSAREICEAHNMQTFSASAKQKLLAGATSLDEVQEYL
ncbi:MAG: hypothetical protein A3F17_06260 [Gammaproteobacteria bacterium RIFCSPHIGHO2_12_FULL_41_15]|nr:MAG: hypothetical protein A3F17_06260 [Gammaproteobacteria bacterium RIFCSPHIGHO2_12_FULL_41_15]